MIASRHDAMLAAWRRGIEEAKRDNTRDARMLAHRLYFIADQRDAFEAAYRREARRIEAIRLS